MQRIASSVFTLLGLTALVLFPGLAHAGGPTPEHFLDSSSMILEIRYCECQATEPDGSSSELRTEFLERSHLLRVGLADEGRGYASSPELTIGFKLTPLPESPGAFAFNFAGRYVSGDQSSTGSGEVLLSDDQWINLFGSNREGGHGTQFSDVAVRFIEVGDY
ncbi:hypothetical protein [Marinobacter excellens]|jgi:hypothetical protein|nr:hypothetical protein [Marinobacter excellens]